MLSGPPAPVAAPAPPPGCQLLHTLPSQGRRLHALAWSPDGQHLAAASADHTVALWNLRGGVWQRTLRGHADEVLALAWAPGSQTLASAARDGTISLWELETGIRRRTFPAPGGPADRLAWSPDGRTLALGSTRTSVSLCDVDSGKIRWSPGGNVAFNHILAVAWAPDGGLLALGSRDSTIRLWDARAGKRLGTLRGHSGAVISLAWSPDGRVLASGSWDSTVRLWEVDRKRQASILEGHTRYVTGVSYSADGRLLASQATDGTLRLWRTDTLDAVAVLETPVLPQRSGGLAFQPSGPLLATLAEEDAVVQVWELDADLLLGAAPAAPTVHYTNAKVVLVGDTGVGKSGLGLILSGQPFSPTESTHGRHVWTFASQEVDLGRGRRETRETLLWDLAGQPGYRLIHQLHLGEVAVALVVFDSRHEVDPFAGVRHWDRALRQARRVQGDAALPLKKFLVAARTDRGGIGVSPARIDALVRDLGFDGYFQTSAKEGWGIPELTEAIRAAIDWDALPRVSSTELFQEIKALLVGEKLAGQVLSTTQDLYRAFLKTAGAPPDTEDLRRQFLTCVGRVESRGLIRLLSFGNLVLLQPELLDAYASALIHAAKDEPDGLGSIAEEDVRAGRFRMPADERLPDRAQENLLLIATVEDLLRHEIALREQADDGPYLVFPSQLTREHPGLPSLEGQSAVFTFEGPLLNVYATLAVRLSHSGLFKKKEMWRNGATYTALVGGTCGLFLREVEEGSGELTLLFDKATSPETRFQFEEYVHAHLRRRALPESIRRRRVIVCASCNTPLTDLQVRRRQERGFDWITCSVCDERVSFAGADGPAAAEAASPVPAMDQTADTCRDLDAGLVSASGEMRTQDFTRWAGAAKATLALVFTDIVGSTSLATELGNEAMEEVRRAHFRQARRLLQRQGGYEIKTIGDALMVAFRTAVEGLDFALALAADPGHERLRIRAGINVGQVRIQEGDAFGVMVSYTARVAGQAAGPEVWVSDRAKGDIDEEKARAHEALAWREHPDCELKGFAGRHRLWSVRLDRRADEP